MSGIRVDPSHKFSTSTRTSYLAPVAPSHFRLRFFLVVVDSTRAHLEDHGRLRGIHIEHVLLNQKCSTKKIGMTSPNSRTYGVPEFVGTEFNRRSGNLKGLTGYLHKHFTKNSGRHRWPAIASHEQHFGKYSCRTPAQATNTQVLLMHLTNIHTPIPT